MTLKSDKYIVVKTEIDYSQFKIHQIVVSPVYDNMGQADQLARDLSNSEKVPNVFYNIAKMISVPVTNSTE